MQKFKTINGGYIMQVAESVQGKALGMLNFGNRIADIAQAVSMGVISIGQPGTIAATYYTVSYKIVARYMRELTDDPPPMDIEIKELGTEKPMFQCKDEIHALETLHDLLITQDISFVKIETKHPVFWYKEEIYVLEILIDLLIEKDITFITKTGDGSGENPFIILQWERETKECAR
jgi:hypothetical protein